MAPLRPVSFSTGSPRAPRIVLRDLADAPVDVTAEFATVADEDESSMRSLEEIEADFTDPEVAAILRDAGLL